MMEVTPRLCPFCNKSFTTIAKIQAHLLIHFGQEFPQKTTNEFKNQNHVKLEPLEPICNLELDQKTNINVKSEVENSSKSTRNDSKMFKST